jgi:hypothetical protein
MTTDMLDPVNILARPDQRPGRLPDIRERLRSGGGRLALFAFTFFAVFATTLIGIGWIR